MEIYLYLRNSLCDSHCWLCDVYLWQFRCFSIFFAVGPEDDAFIKAIRIVYWQCCILYWIFSFVTLFSFSWLNMTYNFFVCFMYSNLWHAQKGRASSVPSYIPFMQHCRPLWYQHIHGSLTFLRVVGPTWTRYEDGSENFSTIDSPNCYHFSLLHPGRWSGCCRRYTSSYDVSLTHVHTTRSRYLSVFFLSICLHYAKTKTFQFT